jgi:hypothetical protein
LVPLCAKTFVPEPGHARFCCEPPDHTTDHTVIFRGRTLRYANTSEENI